MPKHHFGWLTPNHNRKKPLATHIKSSIFYLNLQYKDLKYQIPKPAQLVYVQSHQSFFPFVQRCENRLTNIVFKENRNDTEPRIR